MIVIDEYLAVRVVGGGWLTDETLAAGLHHGRALWFDAEQNVGRGLAAAADELGITVHVVI